MYDSCVWLVCVAAGEAARRGPDGGAAAAVCGARRSVWRSGGGHDGALPLSAAALQRHARAGHAAQTADQGTYTHTRCFPWAPSLITSRVEEERITSVCDSQPVSRLSTSLRVYKHTCMQMTLSLCFYSLPDILTIQVSVCVCVCVCVCDTMKPLIIHTKTHANTACSHLHVFWELMDFSYTLTYKCMHTHTYTHTYLHI